MPSLTFNSISTVDSTIKPQPATLEAKIPISNSRGPTSALVPAANNNAQTNRFLTLSKICVLRSFSSNARYRVHKVHMLEYRVGRLVNQGSSIVDAVELWPGSEMRHIRHFCIQHILGQRPGAILGLHHQQRVTPGLAERHGKGLEGQALGSA